MGTMDYILIGAIILFALIGLIRGGAKMFFGLFLLLIIMVGSALISALVCPLFLKTETETSVEYSGAATALMDPFAGMLPSDEEYATLLDTPVTADENGTLHLGDQPLVDAISEKVPNFGSTLAPLLKTEVHVGETLRTTFAYKLTEYVYETLLWVILVIILAVIRNIVRKKIYLYLDRNSGPSKVDRVIGLILNVAILMVILWGVGAIAARFDDGSNWAYSVNAFMTEGSIANPLMTNNPLLKIMGITLS